MAWSDETRCLHCDGKLPLYRKLTSGQFCSAAHRRAYWQEQERLAVERLHQTHDSLRVYRPPGAIEAILGAGAAETNPYYTDREALIADANEGILHRSPSVSRDPVSSPPSRPDAFPPAFALGTIANEIARHASNLDNVAEPGFFPLVRPQACDRWDFHIYIEPAEANWTTIQPLMPSVGNLPFGVGVSMAGPVGPGELKAARFAASPSSLESATHLEPRVGADYSHLRLLANPETPELEGATQSTGDAGLGITAEPEPTHEETYPQAAGALALPPISAHDVRTGKVIVVEPLSVSPAICISRFGASSSANEQSPNLGGLLRLPAGLVQAASENHAAHVTKTEPQPVSPPLGSLAPVVALSTDSIPTSWGLAGGVRYPVTIRDFACVVAKAEVDPAASESLTIELPCGVGELLVEPSFGWLLPVPFDADERIASSELEKLPRSLTRIDIAGQEPTIPPSRLAPLEGALEPQSKLGFLTAAARTAAGAFEPKFAWTHAVDFWQHAPRDLKLLVFAIPALLGLALHPSLPKFSVTPSASASTQEPSGLQSTMREHFQVVRETVSERAGVELTEDFRSGLDAWQSRGDLSAAWSFDSNGFVRPGMLAFYRPSMMLKDYDVNFLGLIDKKAMNFVVRAQDFDNYYVVKLMILKPGPLPTLGITRYAVINGKPDARHDVIAPINVSPDMLYRVSLNVHDDTFLLEIQGKIADSWTEGRLTHGGVGFFAARGEESRLRWIQVTHQYDMLGRLCAYLAPYNIPMTNGSW